MNPFNHNLSFGNIASGSQPVVPIYGYSIDYSCRFNDNDSDYLSRTTEAADGIQHTASIWVKRSNLGSTMMLWQWYSDGSNHDYVYFRSSDKLAIQGVAGGAYYYNLITSMVFRDTSNWYHIFIHYDRNNATAADRIRLWVNGSEVTDFDTETNPSQNAGGYYTNYSIACTQYVGRYHSGSYFDGYLAEHIGIDNALEAVTDFGKFKGTTWVPKQYTGNYGTNGFYLDFADSADLGDDESGNTNDFTEHNIAAADQMYDSPTNNHPVLTLLHPIATPTRISNGGLQSESSSGADASACSDWAFPNTGKWYFEIRHTKKGIAQYGGICNENADLSQREDDANMCGWDTDSTALWVEGVQKAGYFASKPTSNWVGVLMNMDDGKISAQMSGDINNTEYSLDTTNHRWFGWVGMSNALPEYGEINFGQYDFALTVPDGYQKLCSANLDDPDYIKKKLNLDDVAKGFDVVTWSGDEAQKTISDLTFKPDMIWTKNRDAAYHHVLQDSVRGWGGATKISPNQTVEEDDSSVEGKYGYVESVNSSGFVINGDNTPSWLQMNNIGEDYVAWCWKESPTYGFDIVSYTGTGATQSISHNLGGIPELIIIKNLIDVLNWNVYHHHALNKTDPETDYGILNTTAAFADNNAQWNDTAPTSTEFTLGSSGNTNGNGDDMIAYLFRSIDGFSKVFSYEGNGSADGPFVYCGFRPRFVLLKDADGAYHWRIKDTARDTYNPCTEELRPNNSNAEATYSNLDILSNGFKLKGSDNGWNRSGATHIGIAFAEQPFKYSNAR